MKLNIGCKDWTGGQIFAPKSRDIKREQYSSFGQHRGKGSLEVCNETKSFLIHRSHNVHKVRFYMKTSNTEEILKAFQRQP